MDQFDADGKVTGRARRPSHRRPRVLSDILPKKIPFSHHQQGDVTRRRWEPDSTSATASAARRRRCPGGPVALARVRLRTPRRHLHRHQRTWHSAKKAGDAGRRRRRRWRRSRTSNLGSLITDGERYNKVIDIWAQVTEQVAGEMMSEIGTESGEEGRQGDEAAELQPHLHHGDSGARVPRSRPPAGGYARTDGEASGEIIETPSRRTREGPHRAAVLHLHARRPQGLADTALKTATPIPDPPPGGRGAGTPSSPSTTCGTMDGIALGALVEAARSSSRWASASWAAWPW